MPYASLAALQRRFGEIMLVQLTDRGENSTGVVDAAVVGDALVDTDAVIDASLARRYRLPLATVPPVVADLALSIAIYKLHRSAPDDKIDGDYKQALKDLDAFANGSKLLNAAGVEPEASAAGGVVFTDRERMFTNDSLRGFI